jgi:hypothetical protein
MAEFVGSPASSVQYAALTSPSRASGGDTQGEVRMARFNYTHTAAAGTGEVNLVRLPPGRLCIFSVLSHIFTSVMGVNADLHLGYRAHRKEDGTPVAQDDNAFLNDLDSTGGIDTSFGLPVNGILELESQQGLIIFATVDTGNILTGNTITGWIMYSRV